MASTRLCNLLGSGAEPVASAADPFITVFLSASAFPLCTAAHFSPQAAARFSLMLRSHPSLKQSRNSSRRFNNVPAAVVVANFNKYLRRFLRNACRRKRNSDRSSDTEGGPPSRQIGRPCWMWLKKLLVCFPLKLRRELKGIRTSERRKKSSQISLLLRNIGGGGFLTAAFSRATNFFAQLWLEADVDGVDFFLESK